MKIIYVAFFNCILSFFVFSETKVTKNLKPAMDIIDATTLEKIIEVNLSKEEIVIKLEEWIKSNFADSKSSIQEINKDQYYIKGKGNLILTWQNLLSSSTQDYYFEYRFDIKDNKIKFQIQNIYSTSASEEYIGDRLVDTGRVQKTYYSGKYNLEFVSKMITAKNIIENLKLFVNGDTKEKSNW